LQTLEHRTMVLERRNDRKCLCKISLVLKNNSMFQIG
jgi:hypothetical protein